MRFLCPGLILVFLLMGMACRYPSSVQLQPPDQNEDTPQESRERSESRHVLEVVASWYGHPYHGRRTANGELYDMNLLTAAHRSWRFHTLVRVTHLGNGRQVLVRINDRGPFVEGREIDLSREAARRLGMLEEGTAKVRLEIMTGVEPMPPSTVPTTVSEYAPLNPRGRFRLQLGAFSSEKNAMRLLKRLQSEVVSMTFRIAGGGALFRVLSSECIDEAEGEEKRKRLRELGFESILRVCN